MKPKPLTPQQRHARHPAEVRPGAGPHAARLWCVRCNKHIQWISQAQANYLKGL
jgi:hypothetical protein